MTSQLGDETTHSVLFDKGKDYHRAEDGDSQRSIFRELKGCICGYEWVDAERDYADPPED